ncbi:sugar phosphate isomerase/epimerase family protein [Ruminococcus sp.]|uniref:sugar phosphate isomerase/epimerase family protein n=1 Tax=Ruminococcus sp. TaxID=41978 RepID=UPI00258780C2|nr:sugar phosphate isomerase/epimerase family protein [Ruminococcus sp.]MCR5019774.1 sugar phosphate isomerase/epimerase [Ruminococcus sp.]
MMKLNIRAHDLGVKGEQNIVSRLDELGLDGVQLVTYKCLEDVSYTPASMSPERAQQLNDVFRTAGKNIPLIGAYFNPVHPDVSKIQNGMDVFKDHLRLAKSLGCDIVGSETGSYNGDKWTYHPDNRTDKACRRVIEAFGELCSYAGELGVNVGMEGAFGHVCYDVSTLDKVIKAIGSPNIRIIFDLYNYLDISNIDRMYDILDEGLQTFGDRICVFHIKDCVIADGTLRQCGVGKGIFDYDRIISEIRKVVPYAELVLEGTTGDDIPFAVKHLKDRI